MGAPINLHEKLDEIYDNMDLLLIAGGEHLANGNISIRVFAPNSMPLFFACVASDLARLGGSAERCPPTLGAALTSIAQRIDDELSGKPGPDFREHPRVAPSCPASTVRVGNISFPCEIKNISRSGAAIRSVVKLQNRTKLLLGRKTKATVVRQMEDGFAVQFAALLPFEIVEGELEL